jgi:phosphoglycolate phosphatase
MPQAGLSTAQLRRPLRWQAVLFDLDGTLVDSAPDLGAAANVLRKRRGLEARPMQAYRAHCGSGAKGMLSQAFGTQPAHPEYPLLKTEFLDCYEAAMLRQTRAFDGIAAVVQQLQALGCPWGIVTNKAARFARPLSTALGLDPGALVCGDSTPHTKPHPAPLLACAAILGVDPAACVYVGDDLRDMVAGRAAGMSTAAACWGYLGPASNPADWEADFLLRDPRQLLKDLGVA